MPMRAAVVVLVLYSVSAFAQIDCAGAGRIEGRVVDSDGRPVADAEVTVLSEQVGLPVSRTRPLTNLRLPEGLAIAFCAMTQSS
jgi:hypothetical protein